jgi:hypothetical protein
VTQQVVKAVCKLKALDPVDDDPSFQLHFEATGAAPFMIIPNLLDDLVDFINVAQGTAGLPPSSYIGEQISRATDMSEWSIFDVTAHLNGTAAGAPIAVRTFTLNGGTGSAYASGVAACFDYRADYGTDAEFGPGTRPRARDRNRFYLGPLSDFALNHDSTTNRVKLKDTFRTDIFENLNWISERENATDTQRSLVVWSRVAADTKHATLVFADDRPDYQRRRSDPSPTTVLSRALQD